MFDETQMLDAVYAGWKRADKVTPVKAAETEGEFMHRVLDELRATYPKPVVALTLNQAAAIVREWML